MTDPDRRDAASPDRAGGVAHTQTKETTVPDEKRVVLVKPGDVLVLGNVGHGNPEDLHEAAQHLKRLGLAAVLLFAADIQLGSLTPEDVAQLAAQVAAAGDHPWQEYNAHGNTCQYPGCRLTQEEHGESHG